MLVLGFDPGSRRTGWGLLLIRGARPDPIGATFVRCGDVESTGPAVDAILEELRAASVDPDVVAVEKVEGFAFRKDERASRGTAVVGPLIDSARASGMLAENARRAGKVVVEMTALQWRGLLFRKPTAKDPEIKAQLPRLIRELPVRSNAHTRDALGVALAVAWHLGGRSR